MMLVLRRLWWLLIVIPAEENAHSLATEEAITAR
jgi:hypothetical protein